MKKRDTQKSRVYEAERRAWDRACAADPKLAALNRDRTVAEAQEIIRGLATRKRLLARYPLAKHLARTKVTVGRNGGYASYLGSISLGVWARRTHYVILHEAVHVYVGANVWHGWEFCAAELWLWRQVYGAEAAEILEASFREHRVRYRKPRDRKSLTAEQRRALTDRLALAREARAAAPPKPWVIQEGARVCREHPDFYWPHPGCGE